MDLLTNMNAVIDFDVLHKGLLHKFQFSENIFLNPVKNRSTVWILRFTAAMIKRDI